MYNIWQFQRAIPDNCTCSLTERNIAINDHNDAMLLYRSIQIQNKTQPLKKVMILLKEHTLYTKY